MLARCFVDTKSKNVYHVIRCVEKGQFVKAEPAFTPPQKKNVYRVFKLSTGEELFSVKKQTFLKYFEIWNNSHLGFIEDSSIQRGITNLT